ncbi:ABC transporter substrate-binding protein [Salidesulfovibrio onnuriiensis]|uniref:ABC transporter substrate-binding protein n=1 Tax=Salidesulfovibrio onnuriiensis TaxID=2583823 RepID=UPI00164EE662|nr:ABC transporter substrate-binding protein [Salidesulfovibrio onnuriiensis]
MFSKTSLALFFLLLSFSAALAGQPTIAAIGPLTGRTAYLGTNFFQSLRYSVDALNQDGGLLGQKVRLVEIDNQSTPEGSSQAVRQAIAQNVDCVIGPLLSSKAIILARELQEAGIPMIAPIATAPGVTRVGDYIFRICFTDAFQGHALAHFAGRQLHAREAAVLIQKNELYSQSLADAFETSLEGYQGKVVFTGEYSAGQKDFTALLKQAIKHGMDVLMIPGYPKEAARIIDQVRAMGYGGPIIGGDGWSKRMAEFTKDTGNLRNCYEIRHFSRSTGNDIARRFLKGFEARYGTIEQDSAALAHDALLAYTHAVQAAGSLDRKKVMQALKRVSFQGATGNISFDAQGDPQKSAMVITYTGGAPQYFMVLEP